MFSKASTSPLVATIPYAAYLREQVIRRKLAPLASTSSDNDHSKLFLIQRKTRALLVNDYIERQKNDIHPIIGITSDLLSRGKFTRKKKQHKRDLKAWSIMVKKKRNEVEDTKKNKNKEFFNVLLRFVFISQTRIHK